MSSTNKTANLQLNQWQLSDPFNMADFNDDNQKIDAALANLPRKKLFDITLTAETTDIQLDLSDLDLSQYAELVFYLDLASSSNKLMRFNSVTNGSAYNYSTPNGGSSMSYISLSAGTGTLVMCAAKLVYFSASEFKINSCFSSSNYGIFPLTEINISTLSTPYTAGDHITVWGVKR